MISDEKSLNRQIAEALGWTEIELYTYWLDDEEGATPVEALRGRRPDWYHRIPDYESSLDAVAAELPARMHIVSEPGLVTLMDPLAETTSLWCGHSDDRQHGAALALLAWALDARRAAAACVDAC